MNVNLEQAFRDSLGHGWYNAGLEMVNVVVAMGEPFTIYKPRLFPDGNQWCALYGENLHEGVAGFGDTPADAVDAFNKAWRTQRTGGPRA